jgi:phage baseplate assembly protein gpV
MIGTIFNAGDLIGKTLIARVRVALYRRPQDGEKPFAFTESGQSIGIVYSYLEASAAKKRSSFYWMFQDGAGFYYVPHRLNFFDVGALKQQGVYTPAEKEAAKAKANESILDAVKNNIETAQTSIIKYLPFVIGGLFLLPIVRDVIKKKM